MNLPLFILCLVLCWAALHFLIKAQVRRQVDEEIDRHLDNRGEIIRSQHRAIGEVRDELRRTSQQMIATAIQSSRSGNVIDRDRIDPPAQ